MSTVDLFLQKSRNHDEFGRAARGRNRSDEDTKTIVAKWRSCNHLFVMVRDSKYLGSFHSSDCETIPARYECVRCGLTNRLIDTEEVFDLQDSRDRLLSDRKNVADETAEWRQQCPKRIGKYLLSKEPINTTHPGVLFDIAIELCLAQEIKTSKKNVFAVMKELNEMETSMERLKISTVVHASALIERYKKKHGLYSEE